MKTNEKKGRRVPRVLTAAVLALAALAGKPAMAIDVDAGDYTALPAGTNLGLLYYQHVDRDRIYAGGNQVSGGSLDSDVGIARYVHYMKVGNFTVDPQFLLPFGTLRGTNNLKALGNTTGVGTSFSPRRYGCSTIRAASAISASRLSSTCRRAAITTTAP